MQLERCLDWDAGWTEFPEHHVNVISAQRSNVHLSLTESGRLSHSRLASNNNCVSLFFSLDKFGYPLAGPKSSLHEA